MKDYIHAGARVKTLENKLLNESQLERLLSAKNEDEVTKVLQDTYLSEYFGQDLDVSKALEKSIIDAKKTLQLISQNDELLNILWVKYDYHNLKTIIKGKKAGLNDSEILENCFNVGMYEAEKMLKLYNENKLDSLDKNLKNVLEKTEKTDEIFEIDLILNLHYFKSIKEINDDSNDFINEYISLIIDMFNVKSFLRSLKIEKLDIDKFFVEGGSLSKQNIEKTPLDSLKKFGGNKIWKEAIDNYNQNGKYEDIEKVADEYVANFVKEKSRDVFSISALFNYFYKLRSNTQLINSIVSTKKAGVSEKEIRAILRRVYV